MAGSIAPFAPIGPSGAGGVSPAPQIAPAWSNVGSVSPAAGPSPPTNGIAVGGTQPAWAAGPPRMTLQGSMTGQLGAAQTAMPAKGGTQLMGGASQADATQPSQIPGPQMSPGPPQMLQVTLGGRNSGGVIPGPMMSGGSGAPSPPGAAGPSSVGPSPLYPPNNSPNPDNPLQGPALPEATRSPFAPSPAGSSASPGQPTQAAGAGAPGAPMSRPVTQGSFGSRWRINNPGQAAPASRSPFGLG